MPVILQPKHKDALKLLAKQHFITLLYGGAGSGKTFVAVYYIFLLLFTCGGRYIIARKDKAAAVDSIWRQTIPDVLSLMGGGLDHPALKVNRNEKSIYVPSTKGELVFMGVKQARLDRTLGPSFNALYFNELPEIEAEEFGTILTRVRKDQGHMRARVIADLNPPLITHFSHDMVMNKELFGKPYDIASLYMHPRDNLPNLSSTYLTVLEGLPTGLRKRYLDGEFQSPKDAIFTEEMIKFITVPKQFDQIIIGIDPAVTAHKHSDLTGIVILGVARGVYYVLDDLSGKYIPAEWANIVIRTYQQMQKKAARVVTCAEVNQGGDLVKTILQDTYRSYGVCIDYETTFRLVNKQAKAEALSYFMSTKEFFFDADNFSALEPLCKQMLGLSYDTISKSPDRLDALIAAVEKISYSKAATISTM